MLSPTKRASLRMHKQPLKPVPPLTNETLHFSSRPDKLLTLSPPTRTAKLPNCDYISSIINKDFNLCSSGAVLVLAKKVQDKKEVDKKKITRRTSRRFIDKSDKDSSDLFCSRSAQKYRIRSMSRSSERPPHPLTQSNTL